MSWTFNFMANCVAMTKIVISCNIVFGINCNIKKKFYRKVCDLLYIR